MTYAVRARLTSGLSTPCTLVLSLALLAGLAGGCSGSGGSHRSQSGRITARSNENLPSNSKSLLSPSEIGVTVGGGLNYSLPGAFKAVSKAGVGWVRMTIAWSWVEPEKGRFDFSKYDLAVTAGRSAGLEILGTLGLGVLWDTAAPPGVLGNERLDYPPNSMSDWNGYVRSTVSHYKNSIHYWEIWNEPDLEGFWHGTPGQYARLLANSYTDIKAVDPSAQVLLGGLSLAGTPGQYDPDFFSQILSNKAYPAGKFFDIANFHQYGSEHEALIRDSYVNSQMTQIGLHRPIWVTEVGYSSDPSLQKLAGYSKGTGQGNQAGYLRDMVEYLEHGLRVKKSFWFSIQDNPKLGPEFSNYGLLTSSNLPKQALKEIGQLEK